MKWKSNTRNSRISLLNEALGYLKVNSGGNIEYSNWVEFNLATSRIDQLLSTVERYPDDLKLRFVRLACNELKKQSYPPERFLQVASKLENQFLSSPFRFYQMGSAVSVSRLSIPGNIRTKFGDHFASLSTRYPKHYQMTDFRMGGSGNVCPRPERNYGVIYTKFRARSTLEAGEIGGKNIDFLRSMINFSINCTRGHSINFGRVRPFNKILLGQYQILRDEVGKVDSDLVWYQPSYYLDESPFSIRQKFSDIKSHVAKCARRIRASQCQQEILESLTRYNSALDERDRHVSLVSLWSVLETLSDTTMADSRKTARRVSFLFRDREKTIEELKYVSEVRNRYIHANVENPDIATCFEISRYYTQYILSFLIFTNLNFSSLTEFGKFLEISHDRDHIRDQIKILEMAQGFLS